MNDDERPVQRLGRLIREHDERRARTPVNLDPATTFEVLTRQMVEDLALEVAALRQRVDALFYLIIGSIVVDVLLRLAGMAG